MIRSALRFLKPAPFAPEIADLEEVKKKYKYWRIRILYSMFFGYAFYYLTRKSFAFAIPGIIADFGFTKAEVGLVGTIFSLTYGVSKFFSGVLSDQSNPRFFMALGLILTGVFNIFFGFSSSLYLMAVFWGLNAWFQGFGQSPCVKLLSYWYSHSERGSWWSAWTVSQNVGGFITPWIVAFCLMHFGWRWAMFVPGVLAIAGGLLLLNRLADVPRTLGLPPIEKFRNDYPNEKKKDEGEEKFTGKQLMLSVLKNKYIWLLATAYFFIYFIRTGIGDWTMLFMIESKGYSQIGAGGIASLFDVGGFLGGICAGWLSDRVFKARRGPVNALFALLLFVCIGSVWVIPGGYAWMDSCMVFMMGFATFGPQMLIGVAVAELANKQASATAVGLAGWIAYLGSALAGGPLGKIVDGLSWQGFFVCMEVSALCSILLLLPLWNAKKAGSLVKDKPSQEREPATT